jgi:L-fuculose-phosphate aldolase
MELIKEREKVAYFMRRLYEQKLTTSSGGNVSLKVGDKILITPSQTDKARITAEQIGTISMDGKILNTRIKLSMESHMHLAVYHARPDVKAIIHAHPVFATSFSVSKRPIKTNLSGEAWALIGNPVRSSYALMGTSNLATNIAEASIKGNVILMENHGVITLGENLLQAFDRTEVLETSAKMTIITGFLGDTRELSPQELIEIDNLFL